MAFQDVNSGKYVQGTKMEVGSSYTGYVLKFEKSAKYDQTNIVLQNAETGERETFLSAGNLKYIIKDGKIEVGQLTRITRLADKMVNGKKSTQFKVEQDPSDTIEANNDASFESIPSALNEPVVAATKVSNADLAAAKVKREAEALAAQATGRKAK